MLIRHHHDTEMPLGTVRSFEGGLYLAELAHPGGTPTRADTRFHSLHQAKEWLIENGAGRIQLEQSDAYYEMVGQDGLL